MKQIDPRFIHLDDLVEEIVIKKPPQEEKKPKDSEVLLATENLMQQNGEFS
jgi:hypothetical protein